jgi:hypothetical protein
MVDDQAKAIEIAPCPFCGPQKDEDHLLIFYEARDVRDGFAHNYWIGCALCGIELSDEYQDDVVKRWNTRAVSISRASQGSGVGTTNTEACSKIDALVGAFADKDKDGFLHHGAKVRDAIVEAFQIGRNIAALSPPATPQAPEDVRSRAIETLMLHDDAPPLDLDQIEDLVGVLNDAHLLATPVTVTMEECREVQQLLVHDGVDGLSLNDLIGALRRVLGDRIQIAGESS